jgi:hypothetical protein
MKKFLIASFVFGLSLVAVAQGPGRQRTNIPNHPRVNQVNKRIDNQERRINQEVREGEMSKKEARQDRQNLKEINQEKKAMRKQDNGHLTKDDQKALNQQLNENSKEIGK